MTLSYSLRLLCILTIGAGLVLATAQLTLAVAARWILRQLDDIGARSTERILYSLQIGPALFAAFVAGAIFLPAYLHGETNLCSESVSLPCLLFAVVVALWLGSAVLRGCRITLRTLRFAHNCRRTGKILPAGDTIPVLALADPGPPFRLVGFFRPLIVVSANVAGTDRGVFELALAHERSHADHLDNWKLLTLSFLPRFDGLLPGGEPWGRPWQRAADWAADDDAVRNDPSRSLLLAEALVTAARAANSASASHTPYICTALATSDAGLAARIDRLIHQRGVTRPSHSSLLFTIASVILLAAAAACSLSPLVYEVSEYLLHLGAA